MSESGSTIRVQTPDGTSEFRASAEEATQPLSGLLARHGVPLNTRCGGRGMCAGCEVHLLDGKLVPRHRESHREPDVGGQVRACQWLAAVDSTIELLIPARSLLRHEPAVVTGFRAGVPWARDPIRPDARYGAAVDVGTTTVVVVVCDLESGAVVGEASGFNAQIQAGEDVLTRIQLCCTDKASVAQLQGLIATATIQPLLEAACAAAKLELRQIGAMTVAGNTTMLHLLAGVDPSPLGIHPFAPVFLEHRVLRPRELGLTFGDARTSVHLLPGAAAYVGADISAGVASTGLLYDEGAALLVDVGTNGEIVAKFGERLVACATAAGPAFEGVGLTSGVRAVRGAIERIRMRPDPLSVDVEIIGGDERPIGICGSAYVDFLWEARMAGLLAASGRFEATAVARAGAMIERDRFGSKLCIHPGRGANSAIWISEVDVARLLQAKAAIAAGIQMSLEMLGTTAGKVRRLHLAGGFGLHLSIEHAIGCGLLPGFTPAQVEVAGNTSLGGAFLALNDRSLLEEMIRICDRIETVELNLQPGFENAYIDHLAIP
jgi:uncharacterized 2Fe-2S/4Fe-4S cluster protein (DUF4445 family)